jgi:hypothetical protein
MTETPIAVLQRAADLGLKLGLKLPDALTVDSAKRWPKDFTENAPRLQAASDRTAAVALVYGVFRDSRGNDLFC